MATLMVISTQVFNYTLTILPRLELPELEPLPYDPRRVQTIRLSINYTLDLVPTSTEPIISYSQSETALELTHRS